MPHRPRQSELSSSMEDYLETIYLQDLEGHTAKVKDIADAMGVSKPSVTEALSVLQDRGLVHHQKYGDVELTERGRSTASQIYYRHQLLFNFFHSILNVPKELAEDDACKIEHLISETSVNHIITFNKFVEDSSQNKESQFAGFLTELHKMIRNHNNGKEV